MIDIEQRCNEIISKNRDILTANSKLFNTKPIDKNDLLQDFDHFVDIINKTLKSVFVSSSLTKIKVTTEEEKYFF